MKVLITGANGFIGKNLQVRLREEDIDFDIFTRSNKIEELKSKINEVDMIVHLAGINRPKNQLEFQSGNVDLTQTISDLLIKLDRKIPILFSSSIQAESENEYGSSKRAAEDALLALHQDAGNPVYIYRLPNVFGKWARPNYNSAVATFCYNVARDLPVQINDPSAVIRLVYVDDVVDSFMSLIESVESINTHIDTGYVEVAPEYRISVGELAEQLNRFKATRDNLITEPVGSGLVRALYSTYVSYLPSESFTYSVPQYGDERGVFVEMLKTPDAGQFSFFTAHPGITRGGHYHHSKTEKFLVIKGKACFRFCHILTGEFYELHTTGEHSKIVETVPGWTHDITNIGDDEMICMLWANEIFDREKPDTFVCPINIRLRP